MDYEKLEKLLKMALALTLLMSVFSTGMNAAVIAQSNIEGVSVWGPIIRALLIIGPILILEFIGFRYVRKKNAEAKAEQERIAKEKAREERKARLAEKKAKQQPKKNKKK